MDEPFAALDAQTREFMQAELLKIWSKSSKTVLFITHQIDEAAFLADRVVVMGTRPGRIKREFRVDFDRPRALSLKRDPRFLAVCDDIWRLIEEEAERIKYREDASGGSHERTDPNPDDGYGAYRRAAAAAFWPVTNRSSTARSRLSACLCCGNSAGRWAQSRRCSSAGQPRSLRNSGSSRPTGRCCTTRPIRAGTSSSASCSRCSPRCRSACCSAGIGGSTCSSIRSSMRSMRCRASRFIR